MAVYKDEKRGTYYVSFRYVDWTGKKRQKMKRGFKKKNAAIQYEAEFIRKASANMDMELKSFVEIYFEDKKNELKRRSLKIKKDMINKHIIPYFGEKRMNEITPADIIQWQNNICELEYSKTYERMLQNQISALFNHAQKIYGLGNNPCKRVKKIGKADAEKMQFWTLEEYEQYLSVIEVGSENYIMAEILFWTGMREGELLALTPKDIDFRNNKIHISKTYYREGRADIITTPKTDCSVRTIEIPEFLKKEIEEYIRKHFEMPENERIFRIVSRTLEKRVERNIKASGVKKIRVHDIRHSHASYLINQGVQPLIIKERLGHKDIKITMNTYGHLYPSQQKGVVDMMDAQRNSPNSANC